MPGCVSSPARASGSSLSLHAVSNERYRSSITIWSGFSASSLLSRKAFPCGGRKEIFNPVFKAANRSTTKSNPTGRIMQRDSSGCSPNRAHMLAFAEAMVPNRLYEISLKSAVKSYKHKAGAVLFRLRVMIS